MESPTSGGNSTVLSGISPKQMRSGRRPASMLRVQLACGFLLAILPSLLFTGGDVGFMVSDPNAFTTVLLSLFAFGLALLMFRRVEVFPGVGVMGNLLPTIAIVFTVTMAAILFFRLDYGRFSLGASFAALAIFLFALGWFGRKAIDHAYYLVPSHSTRQLAAVPGANWVILDSPGTKIPRDGAIIADLRLDHSHVWEREIADFVLQGYKVFHIKQVQEMISGRVQIEHLSENSLGSLAPSESYSSLKRAGDIVFAIVALPMLLPLFVIVAIAIKLDSPGPSFFRQIRVGYRGKPFSVLKFRTMRLVENDGKPGRESAKTKVDDHRITKLGRFLRNTRIDELPQVWNVLRGEMSWIGPRPEAEALSVWYSAELPYYSYRHVVRPGITGWAQVNQGHVTELDEVLDKLHYDFYYIKHFGLWIDVTILFRTILTVILGSGAR